MAMLCVGNQRSYSDVCRLDGGEIIRADNQRAEITKDNCLHCEAGLTIAQILAKIIPLGWMLPVVPGTQWATIGGCIANDVHGKNQPTRGTFGNHVLGVRLERSDGIDIYEPGNPMFHATIGGLGLTGMIKSCIIKLEPIKRRPSRRRLFPLDYTPYWWAVKHFEVIQYQCVGPVGMIPEINFYRERLRFASFKTFTDSVPSVGMLSFVRKGRATAMDFYRPPHHMLSVFDEIVTAWGGALNPSKYAMSAEMFRHSFPRWKEFAQYVDPGYSSNFWQRVSAS